MSRSTLVARNTVWNLLGALLPVPVALVCIPWLVAGLGVERFGVLGVAWMLLGYFGMFDFGLAQSTTRSVSNAVAVGGQGRLGALARGSLLLHGVLGLAGGAIFALLVPWLSSSVFALPPPLVGETRSALYWLAASVPAIVVTAALRGVLEGLQRFDVVNLIRIPASIVNYAAPVLALGVGDGLPLVVGVIAVARYAVLAAYALACLKLVPPSQPGAHIERADLSGLASYGGWLTATNLVNPLIIAADRFIIAASVSAAAVAFYVTPYEIITKAWVLSASLLGALFPVLSALAASDPAAIRPACRSAQIYLLVVAAPAILVVLGSADLLLGWWLGDEFRAGSTTVAQLLAIGILVNIVAQVPLTALNAVGRAKITAAIALVELPLYALAVWWAAARYGIDGVAAVWAARAGLDALALFVAAHLALPRRPVAQARVGKGAAAAIVPLCVFLTGAWLIAHTGPQGVAMRLAMLSVLLAALIAWEWALLLGQDDRRNFKELCARLLTSPAR